MMLQNPFLSHYFYQAGLVFNSPYFYLILYLCLAWKIPSYRPIIYWGCLGYVLSCMLNFILKLYFKVPLPAYLHPGYAFPSGHMQAATYIYTWLALHHILKLQRFIYVLLPWIGFSMMHYKFHTGTEVLAGWLSGLIWVMIFYTIYQFPKRRKTLSGLLFLCYLALYCYMYQFDHKMLWCSLIFISLFSRPYQLVYNIILIKKRK